MTVNHELQMTNNEEVIPSP